MFIDKIADLINPLVDWSRKNRILNYQDEKRGYHYRPYRHKKAVTGILLTSFLCFDKLSVWIPCGERTLRKTDISWNRNFE